MGNIKETDKITISKLPDINTMIKEYDTLYSVLCNNCTISVTYSKGGDKMRACKCDDCGALADEMIGIEEILFRHQNGDHKLELGIYFRDCDDGSRTKELCLKCKIKYLRSAIDRLQKRRDKGEN